MGDSKMNRLILAIVITICYHGMVFSQGGMTTPKWMAGMTGLPDSPMMLATFKPLGTLPPIFEQPGTKIDGSNIDTFRGALDSASQALFDKMRGGDFDLSGENPKDIRRRLSAMKRIKPAIMNKLDAKNYSMSLMELTEIPGDVLSSMTADAQKQISTNLTTNDRDRACVNFFRKRMSGKMLKKLAANFDCTDALSRSSNILQAAQESQLKVLTEVLRTKKPDPSTWSAGDIRTAFQAGPKAADVKRLSESALKAMFNNGDFERDVPKYPEAVNKEICSKIKTVFAGNDFKTGLNDTVVKKLKGIIFRCKEAMDNMPQSALLGAAKEMGAKLANMNKKQMRKLMAKVPDASTMDATTAKNYIDFIARDPKQLRKMSDSNIDAVLGDSSSKSSLAGLPRNQIKSFAKRLKKSNSFKNPSALDAAKINKIPANCLAVMGPKFLKQIPCSAISGAASSIKDAEFQTKAAAKAVFDRCKSELGLSDLSSIDANKIKTLGKALVRSLSASDITTMSASAIAGAKDLFMSMDVDKPSCLAMVKKIKENNGGSIGSCAALGKLRKCLTNSDFSSCGASDLDMDNDTVTPDVSGMSKAQLKKIAKEYLDAKGGMGSGSDSLTSTTIARLAAIIGPGLRPSDSDSISVDTDCSNVVSALADVEDDIDDKVLQKLGSKASECAKSLGISNIDETTAEAFAKSLKFHKTGDSEIETVLPSAVRKAAVLQIAASSSKKISRTKLAKLKVVFFKYRPSAADSSVTEDRSNSPTITSDDIADAGILTDGFQTADVDKLTSDAVKNNIQTLCKSNMEFLAKDRLVQRLRSIVSDLFSNTTNIAQIGGCAGHLSQDDVNKITDTDAESVCTDLVSAMDDDDTTRKSRKMQGFGFDFTTDEETKIKEGKSRLAQRCLSASQANSSRRRKRATTTVTCDDIKQLGASGSQITASQIATLTTDEFGGCAEYLNTLTGWPSDRRDALATKAKETWGSTVSSWTVDQVRMAGSAVVSALTEAEIGTLQLTGTTTASAVGQENYYTPAKLMALFNRYLASNGKSANSLTSDDLNSMNNIACGAADSSISSFSNTAYKDAADSIGLLLSCEAAQLAAYANHAKTAFGSDVTTWSTSTLSSIGSVVGGLGDDISKLSTDQLSTVSPSSIAVIPPTTFAKLTTTQLSNLGEAQANAVTADQQNSLSAEQKTALSSAGAPNKTSGVRGFAQVSVLLMTVAFFFTRL